MATSVSRYNLWERFRVVMWGIAALVPMQLLFIGYSVSQGQQVSFFTALQPAVMFGFALGALFGERMEGYPAGHRTAAALVAGAWCAFIFAFCVNLIFY